ncbi:uncharacterized protein LOC135492867 [Lineus longissimus]|uniref:uncharacterized protein LOC135492867 n=1 Tax=Lineus longissimus TaxID=88925 RepID=UPI002B4E47B3
MGSPNLQRQFLLLVFIFTFHGAFCQTEPDNTAIIVGCSIGGFVFLLLILLAVYYFCKPSKRTPVQLAKRKSYDNQAYTPAYSNTPPHILKTPSLIGNGHSSSLYDGRSNRELIKPNPAPLGQQGLKKTSTAFDYQPRIWMSGSQMLGVEGNPGGLRRLENWDRTTSDPNLYKVHDVVDRHVMSQKERRAVFSANSSSNVQRSQSFGEPRRRPAAPTPQHMPAIPAASEVDTELYSSIQSPTRVRSTDSADGRDPKMSSLRVASELALGTESQHVGVQHFAVSRPDGGQDLYAIPMRSQVSVDGGESEGEESVGQRTLSGSQYGAHGREITGSAFEFLEDYDASMISESELKARSYRSYVSRTSNASM